MVNDIQGTSHIWLKIISKAIYHRLGDWMKLLSSCYCKSFRRQTSMAKIKLNNMSSFQQNRGL